MNESGLPKSFWIAHMTNGTPAIVDKDIEFLGLEIGEATQLRSLVLRQMPH